MSLQTTVVGSYPVPDWLRAYPTGPHLQDAMLVVVRTQELAGIDVVSDGELSRFDVSHPETNGMIDYFVGPMDGVRTSLGHAELERFERQAGLGYRRRPAGVVTGPIGPGTMHLPDAARPLRELSRSRTKFTVTSPYMLAKVLVDQHYGDLRALCMAIAEVLREQVAAVDADVVQVDEANLTGAPEDATWAVEAINHVLEGVRGEAAVHLCFGNYGGQTVQAGTYQQLVPALGTLKIDHLVLECARRGDEDLEALGDLDAGIGIGLGVIDVKDNVVEQPDEIARRIEQAERVLGAGRVTHVHPDCGFWMLQRSVADAKMRALVKGRDRFLGASQADGRRGE